MADGKCGATTMWGSSHYWDAVKSCGRDNNNTANDCGSGATLCSVCQVYAPNNFVSFGSISIEFYGYTSDQFQNPLWHVYDFDDSGT